MELSPDGRSGSEEISFVGEVTCWTDFHDRPLPDEEHDPVTVPNWMISELSDPFIL